MKKTSESFRKVRKRSERTDKSSEAFGRLPNVSERTSEHTLTVHEVALMFERAGVPRTERSIINWCTPNRQNITRLDSYFDPNEHRHFIARPSVERAINEEQDRAHRPEISSSWQSARPHVASEPSQVPTGTATPKDPLNTPDQPANIQQLEKEMLDLNRTSTVRGVSLIFTVKSI